MQIQAIIKISWNKNNPSKGQNCFYNFIISLLGVSILEPDSKLLFVENNDFH